MKFSSVLLLHGLIISLLGGAHLFAETTPDLKKEKNHPLPQESTTGKTETELGNLAKETVQVIQPLAKDVEKALKPLAKKAKCFGKELKKGLKEDLQKKPDSSEKK
ncbi:MAG: hypothetical protein K2P93_06025 [Alphaproteobacteria bacterium]|nr:hypothetical protein [Alphaproteobacteria bacterium]